MHLFKSHGDRPGMFRGHAHFDRPDNPICWLRGHSPKVEVQDPGFNMEPWLLVTCRVCGRRRSDNGLDRSSSVYDDVLRDAVVDSIALDPAAYRARVREKAKEYAARRVQFARTDPRGFEESISRREGWGTGSTQLSLEAIDYRRYKGGSQRVGFSIHLGNRHSETPIDLSAHAWWWGCYVTVGGIGGRFAQWAGRGHKRDVMLETSRHGAGSPELRWKLWYDDDHGSDDQGHRACRSKPVPWDRPNLRLGEKPKKHYRTWRCLRDGSIDLNPLTALWGHRLYSYTDVEVDPDVILEVGEFPGDNYPVTFTLQRQHRARAKGPSWARRRTDEGFVVDWRAEKGIPFRNHEWKGDNTYASAVRLPAGTRGRWKRVAHDLLVEDIKAQRRRYGYRPPAAV